MFIWMLAQQLAMAGSKSFSPITVQSGSKGVQRSSSGPRPKWPRPKISVTSSVFSLK
jgi:hypothetical protein